MLQKYRYTSWTCDILFASLLENWDKNTSKNKTVFWIKTHEKKVLILYHTLMWQGMLIIKSHVHVAGDANHSITRSCGRRS